VSLRRLNPKRDIVEAEVIGTLEAYGCQCWQLSGRGIPDLLVAARGRWYVVECKTGKKGLTPDQLTFHRQARAPVAILRSSEEAASWAKMLRKKSPEVKPG
jgi:Holliday junction resolvase